MITSQSDYYGIIFDYWRDLEPFKTKLEFGNSVKEIKFKQTIQYYYNFGGIEKPKSTYDCYAQLMSQANATNCTKNCLSTRGIQGYLPLIKLV